MSASAKGIFFGLLGFAAFSVHDVLIKHLGATYSTTQILFYSVLFAFPLFSFMLVGTSSSGSMRPRHPWWTAIRIVTIIANTLCVFYAFSVLPLTQTYSILFAIPLMITLLAVPILGEKVGIYRGGAVFAGFLGVLVTIRPDPAEISWGHLAALGGVIASALSSVIVRRIGRDESVLALLLLPMLASFIVMGFLLPLDYRPMSFEDLVVVAVLSLFGFIGINCLIVAYQTSPAVVVAPLQYSQIVWATLFGMYLFGETLENHTIVGTALVISSGMFIVIRESLVGNSRRTPVLRTRGRIAGTIMRIGPLLRARQRKRDRRR